jgi:hypothetical protein
MLPVAYRKTRRGFILNVGRERGEDAGGNDQALEPCAQQVQGEIVVRSIHISAECPWSRPVKRVRPKNDPRVEAIRKGQE